MSDFQELIKSFPKTREYVRDFFVYGFKNRNEFKGKSPRTYDNERRRLESWLSPYVRKDYTPKGFNISLAIDSNLLDTNPLFQVWKTKSFTDNDIVLHFLILNILIKHKSMSIEDITDTLLTEYESFFDVQTVRRKCNTYVKEGLLQKEKKGKTVLFSLDTSLALWLKSNENIKDALSFFQMAGNFGIMGNHLLEHLDWENHIFRVKHSFFVHTLEDEVLYAILNSIKGKTSVKLELKSSKTKAKNTADCIPLQIFTSTRSGRRFLCAYIRKSRRFTCYRLDTIQSLIPLEKAEDYDTILDKLNKNRQKLWVVSFQSDSRNHLDKLTMTLHVKEPSENYILDRLDREGRGGSVTKIRENIYKYETEVFDCNEMLPWIRTFIGRIVSLECTDKSVEARFYQDLNVMCQMYQISETQ